MNNPLVSIIIPAFNSEDYIAETLESALSQVYQNFEIIVINDGSKDSTDKIIAKYQNMTIKTYTSNNGVSTARNIGILHAKGKYIAFLDSDDIWHPEKLNLQVNYLETHPDILMVANSRKKFKNSNEITFKNISAFEEQTTLDHYQILRWNPIHCSSSLIKKHVFAHCGLFNTQINNASEDTEMWARIACFGKIVIGKDFLSWLRTHETNITKSDNFKINRLNSLAIMARYWNNDPKAKKIIHNNLNSNAVGVAYEAEQKREYVTAKTCFKKAYFNNPVKIKFLIKYFYCLLMSFLQDVKR